MNIAFVCIVGILTVFISLICLIFIVVLTSYVCRLFAKPQEAPKPVLNTALPSQTASSAIENKQEIVAGVCAVIAEELGTDVSNIKVTSFKKL